MLLSLAGNDLCRIAVAPHTGSVNLNTKSGVKQMAIFAVAPHTGSVNLNCPHNADEKITKRRSPYGERESKCRRAI